MHMPESIQIRSTEPTDGSALRSLRLRAQRDSPRAFGATFAEEAALPDRVWQERATRGETEMTVVAVRGDAWVGMAAGLLQGDADDRVRLVGMWVAPEARRQSVGRLLVRAVATWARGHHAGRLELGVADGNQAAIQLYERCGFVFTGVSWPHPHSPTSVVQEMMLRL